MAVVIGCASLSHIFLDFPIIIKTKKKTKSIPDVSTNSRVITQAPRLIGCLNTAEMRSKRGQDIQFKKALCKN